MLSIYLLLLSLLGLTITTLLGWFGHDPSPCKHASQHKQSTQDEQEDPLNNSMQHTPQQLVVFVTMNWVCWDGKCVAVVWQSDGRGNRDFLGIPFSVFHLAVGLGNLEFILLNFTDLIYFQYN